MRRISRRRRCAPASSSSPEILESARCRGRGAPRRRARTRQRSPRSGQRRQGALRKVAQGPGEWHPDLRLAPSSDSVPAMPSPNVLIVSCWPPALKSKWLKTHLDHFQERQTPHPHPARVRFGLLSLRRARTAARLLKIRAQVISKAWRDRLARSRRPTSKRAASRQYVPPVERAPAKQHEVRIESADQLWSECYAHETSPSARWGRDSSRSAYWRAREKGALPPPFRGESTVQTAWRPGP